MSISNPQAVQPPIIRVRLISAYGISDVVKENLWEPNVVLHVEK